MAGPAPARAATMKGTVITNVQDEKHPEATTGYLDELRLTSEQRIVVLETSLDLLTIRIADEKNLLAPAPAHVNLLQNQIRLLTTPHIHCAPDDVSIFL